MDLSSLRNVELRSVLIRDHKKDTLIIANSLTTSILNYSNLISSDLDFGSIDLKDGALILKTHAGDTLNNLTVFSKKFKPRKSNPEKVFTMSSSSIYLDNVDFILYNFNKKLESIVYYNVISGFFDDFDIS